MLKAMILITGVMFSGFLFQTAASAAGQVKSDAATYHGNPARTGQYEGKVPKSTPMARWVYETGSFVRSSAALSDGNVYFGSNDGYFYCLDAAKGGLKWRFQADAPVDSTAALHNGAAYFTDATGSLYCVDLTTGKARFNKPSGKPYLKEGWDYFSSSPLIANGLCYYGSTDGNLYAVNAEDGSGVWSLKAKGKIKGSPALADGTIYVGDWKGTLWAADALTGAVKWSYRTGDALQNAPAVADGVVYVCSRDCMLHAVDVTTGKAKWKHAFDGSWVLTTPALADDKVITGNSDLQTVDAFDARTGKLLWSFNTHANVFSSPIIVGDKVVACGWDGYVHVLELATGKEIYWRGFLEGQIQSTPVYDNGAIYVGSDNHCFYMMK